jgi:WhiB family transcriptional regulator, redox-sensing transcriptional regulator
MIEKQQLGNPYSQEIASRMSEQFAGKLHDDMNLSELFDHMGKIENPFNQWSHTKGYHTNSGNIKERFTLAIGACIRSGIETVGEIRHAKIDQLLKKGAYKNNISPDRARFIKSAFQPNIEQSELDTQLESSQKAKKGEVERACSPKVTARRKLVSELTEQGYKPREITAITGITSQTVRNDIFLNKKFTQSDNETPFKPQTEREVVLLERENTPKAPLLKNAACKDSNIDNKIFQPLEGNYRNEKEAKAICGTCDEKENCLSHALENKEQIGIWGGLTHGERQKIIDERQLTQW